MKHKKQQSGFTLVELAIVLVIIGLIVGGVLAGQDLIKAAEQRAAIGQIEKLDTVVNAFRGKYNGLPGDLANAGNFSFAVGSVASTPSLNGNGVLDPQASSTGPVNLMTEEVALFFTHLASAGLINENISRTQAQVTAGGVSTSMSDNVPISKFGKGIYIWAQSSGGVNYYMLDNATVAATGVLTPGINAMPRIAAFNMDSKLDDGVPTTGKVQAVDNAYGLTTTNQGNTAADKCADTTTSPASYSMATAGYADAAKCSLRIKASF